MHVMGYHLQHIPSDRETLENILLAVRSGQVTDNNTTLKVTCVAVLAFSFVPSGYVLLRSPHLTPPTQPLPVSLQNKRNE